MFSGFYRYNVVPDLFLLGLKVGLSPLELSQPVLAVTLRLQQVFPGSLPEFIQLCLQAGHRLTRVSHHQLHLRAGGAEMKVLIASKGISSLV